MIGGEGSCHGRAAQRHGAGDTHVPGGRKIFCLHSSGIHMLCRDGASGTEVCGCQCAILCVDVISGMNCIRRHVTRGAECASGGEMQCSVRSLGGSGQGEGGGGSDGAVGITQCAGERDTPTGGFHQSTIGQCHRARGVQIRFG